MAGSLIPHSKKSGSYQSRYIQWLLVHLKFKIASLGLQNSPRTSLSLSLISPYLPILTDLPTFSNPYTLFAPFQQQRVSFSLSNFLSYDWLCQFY